MSPQGSFDDACASQPVSVGSVLAVSQPRCLEKQSWILVKGSGQILFCTAAVGKELTSTLNTGRLGVYHQGRGWGGSMDGKPLRGDPKGRGLLLKVSHVDQFKDAGLA